MIEHEIAVWSTAGHRPLVEHQGVFGIGCAVAQQNRSPRQVGVLGVAKKLIIEILAGGLVDLAQQVGGVQRAVAARAKQRIVWRFAVGGQPTFVKGDPQIIDLVAGGVFHHPRRHHFHPLRPVDPRQHPLQKVGFDHRIIVEQQKEVVTPAGNQLLEQPIMAAGKTEVLGEGGEGDAFGMTGDVVA